MTEIIKSCVVRALAGRDKGKLFFVSDTDGEYVYLADGKTRKIENPKRKKLKHVEFISYSETHAAQKLRQREKVLNREIRKGLAEHCNPAAGD
jgi:ribosomal protein L14E/L6E/L27E